MERRESPCKANSNFRNLLSRTNLARGHRRAGDSIFVLALILVFTQAAQAQTFKVLYNFTGGVDGANPLAGLTMDKAGNLYGTAIGVAVPATLVRSLGYRRKAPAGSLTPLYAFSEGATTGLSIGQSDHRPGRQSLRYNYHGGGDGCAIRVWHGFQPETSAHACTQRSLAAGQKPCSIASPEAMMELVRGSVISFSIRPVTCTARLRGGGMRLGYCFSKSMPSQGRLDGERPLQLYWWQRRIFLRRADLRQCRQSVRYDSSWAAPTVQARCSS